MTWAYIVITVASQVAGFILLYRALGGENIQPVEGSQSGTMYTLTSDYEGMV